jgi:hypothetical protein
VPSRFLSFPDENHWVLKPENSLAWHKTVLDRLNSYVGLSNYSQEGDEAYEDTLMNGLGFREGISEQGGVDRGG